MTFNTLGQVECSRYLRGSILYLIKYQITFQVLFPVESVIIHIIIQSQPSETIPQVYAREREPSPEPPDSVFEDSDHPDQEMNFTLIRTVPVFEEVVASEPDLQARPKRPVLRKPGQPHRLKKHPEEDGEDQENIEDEEEEEDEDTKYESPWDSEKSTNRVICSRRSPPEATDRPKDSEDSDGEDDDEDSDEEYRSSKKIILI